MNSSRFLKIEVSIILILFVLFIFPKKIFCGDWLKIDPTEERTWIDTSHWENEQIWITDGYFREVSKKEWIDNSYTVNQGYWETEEYLTWVTSSTLAPYTEYRWIDTSHWESRYRYAKTWVPVNLIIYVGTNSYGWSVYSFAAKPTNSVTIIYNGNRYRAKKWVIDYRPSFGGRIYAIKYLCYEKEVQIKEYYNVWISSGYLQSYTTYKTKDTSHWETGTRRVWVDTSYTITSGYWHYTTRKEWVDTSHYEFRPVWVTEGFYTEPFHGKVTIQKNPAFIFTKWHKNQNNEECNMELNIGWKIDNSDLSEREEEKEIVRINIYQDINRYNNKGIDKVTVFNGNVPSSTEGSINTVTKFNYSGSEDSVLHIYLYTQNGESAHIYFSNPINGFRSINLMPEGSSSNANAWLGGNSYGEIEF